MNRGGEAGGVIEGDFLYARGDEPSSVSRRLTMTVFSLRTWR